MRSATLALYGLFGVLATIGGLAVVVNPSLILPLKQADGLAGHLMQEQGALFVFVGLMLLWCFRHYADSRPVHLALIAFLALFSGVHWQGYLQDGNGLIGAAGTAILLLLLIPTIPQKRTYR